MELNEKTLEIIRDAVLDTYNIRLKYPSDCYKIRIDDVALGSAVVNGAITIMYQPLEKFTRATVNVGRRIITFHRAYLKDNNFLEREIDTYILRTVTEIMGHELIHIDCFERNCDWMDGNEYFEEVLEICGFPSNNSPHPRRIPDHLFTQIHKYFYHRLGLKHFYVNGQCEICGELEAYKTKHPHL